MRYYIFLFITFLFPICVWGQSNPHNPDEPSMDRLTPNYDYAVYKNGVTFTNKSKGASRYLWNFGDGNTSTLKHPEHIYSQPGSYKVELTVKNGKEERTVINYIMIAPESEYSISGSFTLNPSQKGIRNFQLLDDMFRDLMELPLSGDVTITVAQDLDLSLSNLNMTEVANKLIPKLKDSPYKVKLEQENGNSSFLSLWNELNKENYGLLEQLVQYMDWGVPVRFGNESFHIGN